jgi:glycosyltransferase involved in cell wall biosynthesis
MSKIGILLPAYNEEENIRQIIDSAKKHINDAEIVVIDDGSRDRTEAWARAARAYVIRHSRNLGKGEAVKTGFNFFLNQSKAEFVVIVDADGQYMTEEVPALVRPLQQRSADVVMGCRNWAGKPLRHRMGNIVWKHCFNMLFGTHFEDTNCGFMAFTRDALSRMKKIGGGYIIESEILVEAIRNKLKVQQVPVTVRYGKKSHLFRGIRVVLGVLVFINKEGLRYRLGLA